jgi:hypothetical protein
MTETVSETSCVFDQGQAMENAQNVCNFVIRVFSCVFHIWMHVETDIKYSYEEKQEA